MCKHYDCIHYSTDTQSCDFSLIMGRLRGCMPTDDCREYRTDHKGVKPIRRDYHWPSKITKPLPRLEKYVYSCKTARELAKKAGVTVTFATNWIGKVHPELKWYDQTRAIGYYG